MLKRIPFILILVVEAVLFFTVKDDPFFGDSISSTVRSAGNIYDHQLATVFYPVEHDPGHPTLYAWLLAASWIVFGKTLAVSHFFSALWAIALAGVFVKIARLYLDEKNVIAATVLLLTFPIFLSQSAMMLNTVAFMCFSLVAFYGLLTGKKAWQLTGSLLMMITHTQSTFMLLGLAAADLLVNAKAEGDVLRWFAKKWWLYTFPFLLYCTWIFLHYKHSGWAFHSPNYSDADELNGWTSYIKSIAIITWRLLDFGMAPLYLVAAIAWWRRQVDQRLTLVWFTVLAVTALVMSVFLEHTIGHRYFLCFSMLVIIIVMQYLQQLDQKKRTVLFSVLWLSLFAGNFLYYPGKTLGDGTLAYRNYFSLEKEIQREIGDSVACYSYAPIANEPPLKYLSDEGFYIRRITTDSLNVYPVILQSNVNAEFTPDQKQQLKNWYGKSFEKGAVYVNVFLNPAKFSQPADWKLREPSAFEKWFEGIKNAAK